MAGSNEAACTAQGVECELFGKGFSQETFPPPILCGLGDTRDEAWQLLQDAAEAYDEDLLEAGEVIILRQHDTEGHCSLPTFDTNEKGIYGGIVMGRFRTTIQKRRQDMPKKIQFEWELPDVLADALAQDPIGIAATIKQAAVLDWVRTHKLSLRRGAELLQMTYRAFLELMAAHQVPSIDYEAGWLERELHLLEQHRGATPS